MAETRRAPAGKYRVVGQDMHNYRDYVVADFDTLELAVAEAEQRASKPNAIPPEFSDHFFVYDERGNCRCSLSLRGVSAADPIATLGPGTSGDSADTLLDDDDRLDNLLRQLNEIVCAAAAEEETRFPDAAYFCRVCGLRQKTPPWGDHGWSPTYDICPCCGTEFGAQDARRDEVAERRKLWRDSDTPWFNRVERPENWDPQAQLAQIPKKWRFL